MPEVNISCVGIREEKWFEAVVKPFFEQEIIEAEAKYQRWNCKKYDEGCYNKTDYELFFS
jgi:hypothetical protein